MKYKSENIEFENTILDGSGIVGFNLDNVKNLRFLKSKIQNCTNGILIIKDSNNINFEDSEFLNNFCPEGCVFIYGNYNGVSFSKLAIFNNSSDPESGSEEGNYFVRQGGKFIKMDSTTIIENFAFSILGIPSSNVQNSRIEAMN